MVEELGEVVELEVLLVLDVDVELVELVDVVDVRLVDVELVVLVDVEVLVEELVEVLDDVLDEVVVVVAMHSPLPKPQMRMIEFGGLPSKVPTNRSSVIGSNSRPTGPLSLRSSSPEAKRSSTGFDVPNIGPKS